VFFGVGAVLRIETRKPIALDGRTAFWPPCRDVVADPDETALPTPVTHSATRTPSSSRAC